MAEQRTRQVTDSRVLAAMAHPLRRRLLNLLALVGRREEREAPDDGRDRDSVIFSAHAIPARP